MRGKSHICKDFPHGLAQLFSDFDFDDVEDKEDDIFLGASQVANDSGHSSYQFLFIYLTLLLPFVGFHTSEHQKILHLSDVFQDLGMLQ